MQFHLHFFTQMRRRWYVNQYRELLQRWQLAICTHAAMQIRKINTAFQSEDRNDVNNNVNHQTPLSTILDSFVLKGLRTMFSCPYGHTYMLKMMQVLGIANYHTAIDLCTLWLYNVWLEYMLSTWKKNLACYWNIWYQFDPYCCSNVPTQGDSTSACWNWWQGSLIYWISWVDWSHWAKLCPRQTAGSEFHYWSFLQISFQLDGQLFC